MNLQTLQSTAAAMVSAGHGILAMDESHPTCQKRFDKLGIEANTENRRRYRSMLVSTPNLAATIAGAILFDETIRQNVDDGPSFVEYFSASGIIPGIKVDKGAMALAGCSGEKITEGLDGLRERLQEYHALGARFAKWRAVITIGSGLPSEICIVTNAHALARYAALCQECDIVPIVEPEVLMDGDHTIERCYEVTVQAQSRVFDELRSHGVALSGIVLKPNMVVSGMQCPQQADASEVARMTLQCLKKTVPAEVPGIAFLSGGMSDEDASNNLNAINLLAKSEEAPWRLTFSYGRALQQGAMRAWGGDSANIQLAQQAISKRARLNGAAATGSYTVDME